MENEGDVMHENELESVVNGVEPRPWWSVRVALLGALAILAGLLVALLAKPELLDRGFTLAGL
jgi:hypothetical protein